MKKIILLFALCIGHFVLAQDFYLGAKAGLNLSNFIGENTDQFNQRTAMHAGLTAEVSFSDLLSLQVEALYSQQGAEQDNITYPAEYVAVPVFAKIYPSEFFSFDLGLQISYLLNDENVEAGVTQSIGLKETDISLLAGITYKTKIDLYFQARYDMGIPEIDLNSNWKNQVFQFSIGYNFL